MIGEMRDIRADLIERLRLVITELELCRQRLADLDNQKQLINTLLEAEDQKWGKAEKPDLSEMIPDIMSDGGEWYSGTIAEVLLKRGYDFGPSKPGRVIHFSLLGMAKRGLVESVGNGRWKLKQQPDLVSHNAA